MRVRNGGNGNKYGRKSAVVAATVFCLLAVGSGTASAGIWSDLGTGCGIGGALGTAFGPIGTAAGCAAGMVPSLGNDAHNNFCDKNPDARPCR